MPAKVLDGREISREIESNIIAEIRTMKDQGIYPRLAIIRIGDGEASRSYFRSKLRRARELGVEAIPSEMPATTTMEEASDAVKEMASNPDIHGVIVENEVPSHIVYDDLVSLIPYWKDVDGASFESLGRLMSGKPCLSAATPLSVMEFIRRSGIPAGSMVAVINRSITVGKPLALLLLAENYTPVIMHSRTASIKQISRMSAAVVVATGHAGFLTADFVTENSTVIDVGINSLNGKLVGDADFYSLSQLVRMITPVPGGVGAVTSTMIFRNLITGIRMRGMQK